MFPVVICILAAFNSVAGLPVIGRSITLPLSRVPFPSNVHPQLVLHEHLRRGIRRHARMSGLSEPSDEDLQRRLALVPNIFWEDSLPAKRFVAHAFSTDGSDNQGFQDADNPTLNNSLGLSIVGNDVTYFATVEIGNPPRPFRLIVDSGSSDTWVGSDTCLSLGGGDCGNHIFLGESSSSTFLDTQKDFQITYGSGFVSGSIVQDDLVLAGLRLANHSFGIAHRESKEFSSINVPTDGLMGTARSSLSTQRTPTPVEALSQAGLISEAIVSYKLGRAEDNSNDGEVTFGALDPSKFDPSTLVTVDNVDNGFWIANLDSASVDGSDLQLGQRTALLDTGTTLMIVGPSDAQKIHAAIEGAKPVGQGTFTVPCQTNATVALTIGGQSFSINPKDLAFGRNSTPTGDCLSGIAAFQNETSQWLVGDTFLRGVYFSTNVNTNRISLAKAL